MFAKVAYAVILRWLFDLIMCVRCDCVYVCVGGCRTPITRWPCIGGRLLDLYTLYTSVIKLGGWEKVRCTTLSLSTSLCEVTNGWHTTEAFIKLMNASEAVALL